MYMRIVRWGFIVIVAIGSACLIMGANVRQRQVISNRYEWPFSSPLTPRNLTILPSPTIQPIIPSKIEKDIFDLINAYRKKKNLPQLVWNENVALAASKHSKAMAAKKTPFGHPDFEQRMKAIKIPDVTLIGWSENVASGQLTAKEVVDGWLKSPGHKKNIVGMFHYTGIGVAKNKAGKLYFTQIFVRKTGK